MSHRRIVFPLIAGWALVVGPMSAQAGEPQVRTVTRPEAEFFETRVRPVLSENCFACHVPHKQKSGLRVDSLPSLLKGGENGPVVRPGDPEQSSLIQAVRYDGPLQMPP